MRPARPRVPRMNPLAWLRALRPQQWSKNVFVLAPLAFAWGDRKLLDVVGRTQLVHALYATAAFCLGASAVYLLNDVMDAESDRRHPDKRTRPIAAGEIALASALVLSALLALAALGLGYLAGGGRVDVAWVVASYIGLNLGYSLRWKHVVLVDVFCIALGFVLRVEAGGLAAGAPLSHWLRLCTLFLALFLALNKRRAEIVLLGVESASHRASLSGYTVGFLDQMVTALAAATIVCYALYSVDPATTSKFGGAVPLLWSVPFVVFGLARYMLLVQSGKAGGNPTKVFLGGDVWFLLNTLAWAAVVAAAIWR